MELTFTLQPLGCPKFRHVSKSLSAKTSLVGGSVLNGAMTRETPSGRTGRLPRSMSDDEEKFVWRTVKRFDGLPENLDNQFAVPAVSRLE